MFFVDDLLALETKLDDVRLRCDDGILELLLPFESVELLA
jgi:hypothetical protein